MNVEYGYTSIQERMEVGVWRSIYLCFRIFCLISFYDHVVYLVPMIMTYDVTTEVTAMHCFDPL